MQPMMNIALPIVRSAGELIMRAYERKGSYTITPKAAHDFVTEIDHKVEQYIFDHLKLSYSTHGFLGEESGLSQQQADYLWILDPIDGTTNFIHGFPQFCISLALKFKGITELAIVYDPVLHEEFTALRGRGARLNNQQRLRVTAVAGLNDTLIGTGFPFRPEQMPDMPAFIHAFTEIAKQCAGIRRAGAAALDLAWLAAGRLDGFWESGLSIWDMAAGDLLIREAGGLVTDFNGGHNYLEQGNIVAGNAKVIKALLGIIQSARKSAL